MSVRKKRRRRKRTARNILIIELVLAALVGCGLFLYFQLSATLDKVNQAEIDFGNVQVNSSVQNQDPSCLLYTSHSTASIPMSTRPPFL